MNDPPTIVFWINNIVKMQYSLLELAKKVQVTKINAYMVKYVAAITTLFKVICSY